MGWLWGNEKKESAHTKTDDPLANLDPSLRDFLRKESPVQYSSSNPPMRTAEPAVRPAPIPENTKEETNLLQPEKPTVPKESLFQDGRYAHIWKTYVPLREVEYENKSDVDKINDVLEGYKHRRAEIGRAALENCALEQWEVNECFRSGGLKSTMTLCRTENQALDRCYTMQARFLKALGYLSAYDRSPEVDEQIQMHADTLYHKMLDQEAQIEKAKAESLPVPTFPPLMSGVTKEPTSLAHATPIGDPLKDSDLIKPIGVPQISANERALKAGLTPESAKGLDERLNKLSPAERELEVEAIRAEYKAGEQVAIRLGSIYKKQEDEKKARKEAGKQTLADYLGSLFK